MTAQATRPSEGAVSSSLLARTSIAVKLPLMVGALIFAVTAALTLAAYLEVRRTAVLTATGRLQTVTRRLADALRVNTRVLPEQARLNADRPEVVAYLRDPNPKARDAALKALTYVGPQPEQILAVELRDGSGRMLLATGPLAGRVPVARGVDRSSEQPNGTDGDVAPDSFPRPVRPDSGLLGEFRLLGDTVMYPVVVRVPGQTPAYVIHWRRITTTPEAREQFRELIGSGASLSIGNANGTLWTDLTHAIPAPPVPVDSLLDLATYERGNAGRFDAVAGVIRGTPWIVMLELPERLALAPVGSFLRRIAFIDFLCVATGLVAAWFLSRRMTIPIRNLTSAAHGIAAGDYARPVHVTRADELGILANSFTTMAQQVRDSQQKLEMKVAERTRELNDALVQLRDAQDALVQRERLALLGQLASGVGHELRNPLGVMSNAIYYLDAVLTSSPQNVKDYLVILRQQVALSERIISHLLEFGRTQPPQCETLPLSSIVDTQLQRLPTPDNITIRCEVPASLPPVYVDPVQVGQVVLNLLLNAVQAVGPDGGTVELAGLAQPGGGVCLEVRDSGPGVPAENLERIFEPLFTTKARGMGLGLAVSRSLARVNNGDITVFSPPGQGATFRLTLPSPPAHLPDEPAHSGR